MKGCDPETFRTLSFWLLFFFFNFYFWLCWVLASARGPPPAAASGGHSSSRCAGLPPSRPPAAEHRLQTRRPSSRGSWAQLLRGMWDPPRPGPGPASPALAGRLSTTAPPGKPLGFFLKVCFILLSLKSSLLSFYKQGSHNP